jgi:4-amino-4-deoxy-L-arabinose transferase-like glycosyltransferase
LFLAPFYGVLRGLSDAWIYHGLRAVSLGLCLASLPLLYDVARRASGKLWTARLTCAIVALVPIFGMTSGSVNNDSAALFAVAAFLWLLTRVEDDISLRSVALLGLVFGLGMLCKATVALCDGAALLVFLWSRFGLRSPVFWRAFLPALSVAVIVALPWYARNFAMYGKFSPIESGYSHPALPDPTNGMLVMMMHPNFPTLFGWANWGIFYSIWAQKDWIPETLRPPIYIGLLALLVGAVCGHIRARGNSDGSRAKRLALYAALALNWAVCVSMALFVHYGWAEGGRYLVAAMPALAFFYAVGWNSLVQPKRAFISCCALLLAFNGLCLFWLITYLNPTFGPK